MDTLGESSGLGLELGQAERAERAARLASLQAFFAPECVAVVGASRHPQSLGYRLLQSILHGDFQGAVFPVNPHADAIANLPCYPSVLALPRPADLAILVVPAVAVSGVIEECAQAGVRAVVVISSGFGEVGGSGKELQQRLTEQVKLHGMRLIGPNCLGLLTNDPAVQLNALFVEAPPLTPRRRSRRALNAAMSSDSGALGLALLRGAARLGLGVSSCVSVGNRVDVSTNDLLEYWGQDDRTGVILLYLESFGNPRRFARVARQISHSKPIIAVKAGRTVAGCRAAGSHTAALAANDVAVEALFRQAGVIRAETLEELFDLASALLNQPLPAGRRVAIVTNAGGPAILCADACEAAGLVLPELSSATQTRLRAFLPASASVSNPIDLIASATPEQFRQAVAEVARSGEVDAVIVVYVTAGVFGVDTFLHAVQEGHSHLPLLACVMAEQADPLAQVQAETPAAVLPNIPVYSYPEEPARVLGKMAAYAEWKNLPPGRLVTFADGNVAAAQTLCRQVLAARGAGWLTAEETRALLERCGLPLVPGGVAHTAEEAARLARAVGFPVAVKLASHRIVHKSDVGGVRLNLTDEAEVVTAFDAIKAQMESQGTAVAFEGVQVQQMLRAGTEVFVGVTQDPVFGPLVGFGLGGIHVELLGDVCFRVTPLTDRDAAAMVRSLRGSPLLQGYRGHPPADLPALEELLLRVSALVEELPEVKELDFNPVFALPPGKGCQIADARIRVES